MANTVTIYKVSIYEAFMMAEKGIRFSLRPWGQNTDYYKGDDDGGREYALPEGYEVAETRDGIPHIFPVESYPGERVTPCALGGYENGHPVLFDGRFPHPVPLKPVQYEVMPKYTDEWFGREIPSPVDMDEIQRLSKAWEVPLDELMQQVKRI